MDVDPVLRHFGATKKLARERFELFMRAGMKLRHRGEFYRAEEGRILGSEEFIEQTKNRVGEIPRGARPQIQKRSAVDLQALTKAAEEVTRLKSAEFFSRGKNRAIVLAKEAIIVVGNELKVSNAALSKLIGVDSSVVSRRFDSAKNRMKQSGERRKLVKQVRSTLSSRQA